MDVVKTIETLRDQFEEAKVEADTEEQTTQQEHESVQNGRDNLRTAKLHSASKQNATSAQLAVEIAEKTQEKQDTETARTADEAFLQDITTKCERKAEAWDARSTVRSGELTAISKALEILKGAADTYGATDDVGRKLGIGLLAKGRTHIRRVRLVQTEAPVALLQTREVRRASNQAVKGGLD